MYPEYDRIESLAVSAGLDPDEVTETGQTVGERLEAAVQGVFDEIEAEQEEADEEE